VSFSSSIVNALIMYILSSLIFFIVFLFLIFVAHLHAGLPFRLLNIFEDFFLIYFVGKDMIVNLFFVFFFVFFFFFCLLCFVIYYDSKDMIVNLLTNSPKLTY
jgi:hypothetical protein